MAAEVAKTTEDTFRKQSMDANFVSGSHVVA
jgi:hypothetical protein